MYLALLGMYRVQEGFSGLAVRKLKYQALSKSPIPLLALAKRLALKTVTQCCLGLLIFSQEQLLNR